ncbi:sulfotransferase 2B1-like [Zootoca vivipara]|uniref:sulfotransferase 2B1-like n=1 Tax=Zootoca vivipara TaxID=8524 RepID=UPI00293BB2F9|nr:sulfotransferase 2B1-like [Zootoca vivipara]
MESLLLNAPYKLAAMPSVCLLISFTVICFSLLQDLRGSVERICQFLGKELNSQQIDSVVESPCFKKVKHETMPISSRKRSSLMPSKHALTGLPGDWKHHITVAQNERFDSCYPPHIQGVGVRFPWD